MWMHGADHILPDQIHGIVGFIPQILVQFPHRFAGSIIQICFQRVHKAAALKQRTFFVAQQTNRANQQRVVGKIFQIIGLNIRIPFKTAVRKLFGENSLIPLHRIGIVFNHGHFVPVLLQLRTLHEPFAVDNKMRLNMHRQIAVKMLSLKRIGFCPMVHTQSPEIEVLVLRHRVKHLFQRPHRSHQRRVCHNNLVKFRKLCPAIGIQRSLVRPNIQSLVFPYNNLIRKGSKGCTPLFTKFAVANNH